MEKFLLLLKRAQSQMKTKSLHGRRSSQNDIKLRAMTDVPIRRKFFDAQKEYANVLFDSDASLSDLTSVASFATSEGGYSSDVSDTVISSLNLKKAGHRKKRGKKGLHANPKLRVESVSDTEDKPSTARKVLRRTKSNYTRDYRKSRDGKLLFKADKEEHSRNSWTDSGVSLSQSRSGTMIIDKYSIKTETTYDRSPQDRIILPVCNEKDTFEISIQDVGFEQDRNSSVQRNRLSFNEEINMNRLSLTTDRSSLTNVTILTNPSSCQSSLSSLTENTSLNYASSATETKRFDTDSGSASYIDLRKVGPTHGRTSQQSVVSKDISDDIFCTDIIEDERSNTSLQTNEVSPTSSPMSHDVEEVRRGRGNSLLSGFKKVKEHLKPKFFLSSKHYKDATSEFSYEKTKVEKTRLTFEELTAQVFGKPSSLNIDELERKNRADTNTLSETSSISYDNGSAQGNDKTSKDVDALDGLSSKPNKHNRFLKKFFKRSRSFSAERIVRKSKTKNRFHRGSNDRASLRSIPDRLGLSSNAHEVERSTVSLDHLDMSGKLYDDCEKRSSGLPDSLVLSRTKSLTELSGSKPVQPKTRSNSTPNTPVLIRNRALPVPSNNTVYSPNIYSDECDCDECLYIDYMNYLAFRQFRMKHGLHFLTYNQSQTFLPATNHAPFLSHTPLHAPYTSTEMTNGSIYPNYREASVDAVVAPLSVTVEKDRQAKTLKTSMYDTFV